jgi:hypothetical protein
MAIITTGGGVATISGSVGGVTFSHNRGGPYMRTRAIPTNPNSTFQQAVRGFMSQLTVLWSTVLTAAQRAQWDAYAEAVPLPNPQGEPRNVGGLGMYIRGNVPRLQSAVLARVDDGPTNHTLAAMSNPLLANASEATVNFDIAFVPTDDWANDDDGAMLLYGSRAINVTRNFFKGPYRFAGLIQGNSTTPPTSPATISSPFPLVEPLALHVRAIVVTGDGRVSSDFRDVDPIGA